MAKEVTRIIYLGEKNEFFHDLRSLCAQTRQIELVLWQEALPEISFSIVVVDGGFKEKNSAREEREKFTYLPQLIITEGGQQQEIALCKPFRFTHFVKWLKKLKERQLKERLWNISGMVFDAGRKILKRHNSQNTLTDKEAEILEALCHHKEGLGRAELLECVWGYVADVDTHTLESHLYRLRKKLPEGLLVNHNGKYQLCGEVAILSA